MQKLLQRLEEKGYVERDRTLSIHFFSATVSRAAYGGGQLEALAEKLTAGSLAPMITHLIENKKSRPTRSLASARCSTSKKERRPSVVDLLLQIAFSNTCFARTEFKFDHSTGGDSKAQPVLFIKQVGPYPGTRQP